MKQQDYVPKDPVVIGKTPEGAPIWLEPKDLVPTPDEELERIHNTQRSREDDFIFRIASAVLDNASKFVEETFVNTAGRVGRNLNACADPLCAVEWALQAGYESIQDGLKTVVKVKGRVIREMTATIAPCYRERVAMKVMELVKKIPGKV